MSQTFTPIHRMVRLMRRMGLAACVRDRPGPAWWPASVDQPLQHALTSFTAGRADAG